jgi:hypothetical protein
LPLGLRIATSTYGMRRPGRRSALLGPVRSKRPEGPSLSRKVRPEGCMLVTGPISHNGPFVGAAVGALLGNHVVVVSRFDPAEALHLIESGRRPQCSWCHHDAPIWRLPEALRTGADVSSSAAVIHTGAPCPAGLKKAWIEWLGPDRVLEIYGGLFCPGDCTFGTHHDLVRTEQGVGRSDEQTSTERLIDQEMALHREPLRADVTSKQHESSHAPSAIDRTVQAKCRGRRHGRPYKLGIRRMLIG